MKKSTYPEIHNVIYRYSLRESSYRYKFVHREYANAFANPVTTTFNANSLLEIFMYIDVNGSEYMDGIVLACLAYSKFSTKERLELKQLCNERSIDINDTFWDKTMHDWKPEVMPKYLKKEMN